MSKRARRVENPRPGYPTLDLFDAGRKGLRSIFCAALLGAASLGPLGCDDPHSTGGEPPQLDARIDGVGDAVRIDGTTLIPESGIVSEAGSRQDAVGPK